jgi:hypothetical protein
MTLRLNGSTSGYVEIDAPATAGSNTLTLPTGNGSADQVLSTNGSGTLSFADRTRQVLGTAVASTSGTAIDFTGIPSWVKRITVMFNGVSTSGTSIQLVQIGSGSISTTGYDSTTSITYTTVAISSSTAGFAMFSNQAGSVYSGHLLLTNVSGAIWIASGNISNAAATAFTATTAGAKTLSGTLDRVRITTVNGTDTFDAGSINILYEG